jgi:hypothetical protein
VGLGSGTLYFFSFVRELATPGVLHSENEIEKYLMKGLGPGTFLFCFFLKVLMNTLLGTLLNPKLNPELNTN